jgi:hypothetical protein
MSSPALLNHDVVRIDCILTSCALKKSMQAIPGISKLFIQKFFSMKKNLKDLIKKISEDGEGNMKGGFGSIRGGRESVFSNNDDCTNKQKCTGTNNVTCVNEFVCDETTNKTKNCTNKFTCLSEP